MCSSLVPRARDEHNFWILVSVSRRLGRGRGLDDEHEDVSGSLGCGMVTAEWVAPVELHVKGLKCMEK